MPNLTQFYIDGAWVHPSGAGKFPILNPATGEQIGTIILGNTNDADTAEEQAI